MGAGHSHALYVHEHSPVHRLAPEAKIVAVFGIVASIAITPRQAVWAFGLYAIVVAGLATISRLSPGFVALRLLAIAPFVLFAFFIPFIATGETTEIGGVSVSVEGLWGMWNVLAKATLGASVSIVLTATTEVPDIIRGLSALRIPALFIAIATFMVRYLELIVDELGRMRMAMSSRGYDPRWISQARPIASSAGALFVRSYERGERVHAAMLSRGFNGAMPALDHGRADAGEWAAAFVVTACAALISAIAFLTL
ncbi:MAG TPA: cobalt ECF transporter T component CbiQ [Acidimicrobiia bacterium]